ncbi:MAG: hypothetical protein IJB59_11485 [Oscillospiraceae bacterium]|nr:hypothetical protein [Oscillospiraceae bacterium]
MNLFEMPGCMLIGYVRANNINGGKPIPLFNPAPPPTEKLDINTLEGWNAVAEKQNRRSFRTAFGRDPANDAELTQWIDTQL